jgi:hypothetical protein
MTVKVLCLEWLYKILNTFIQYGCAGIPNLQKVNLRIFSHDDCLDIYEYGPTTDMVCSGIPEEEKGVCSVSIMTVTNSETDGTKL